MLLYISDGAVLDDYPDSPVQQPTISSADANSILDCEEPPLAMDTTAGCSGDTPPAPTQYAAGGLDSMSNRKRKNSTWHESVSSGLSLPPIYYSVAKKRLSKNVVRHLDGNAYNEADGTTLGV